MPKKVILKKPVRSRAKVSGQSNKSLSLKVRALLNRRIVVAFALLFVGLGGYLIYNASFAAQTVLRSGMAGNQCIDSNAGVWDCNGSGGETWAGLQVAGQIKVGGVCLKEAGASASTGTAQDHRALGADIVTYSCGSTSAPYGGAWHWDSSHRLHNNHAESKGGSFCLDVTGSQTHGNLELWSCNGGGNQQWFVGTSATPTPAPGGGGGGGYNDPFRSVSNLSQSRIDQGVDFGGSGPVYAIGPGTITNVYNSGWPDGIFITYKLTDPAISQYGVYVFMAEACTPSVSVGQHVTSSTVICHMYGASGGIETGFAQPPGNGNSLAKPCFDGNDSTTYGIAFNQILQGLGTRISGRRSSTVTCSSSLPGLPSNITNLL
jgi:hypothetical protein